MIDINKYSVTLLLSEYVYDYNPITRSDYGMTIYGIAAVPTTSASEGGGSS